MAVKKKVVDLDTSNAQKSVKSLRNELKELKDQLVNLEQGTDEYSQTLQKAANIQHDLVEMNQELSASAMDFGQIMGNATATIGGAVAGFQALTASMSLLGIENEDALQTIKKLQAIMALTQGIAGVENGIKAFKRLTTAITNSTTITNLFNKATKATAVTEEVSTAATKGLQGAMVGEAAATGTATVATHAFKKALISTGIGAIVVAIGVLIAHLEDLAKWLGFSGKAADGGAEKLKKWDAQLNKLNQSTGYYSATLEEMEYRHEKEINAMDDLLEKMKAEGKTEAEIAAQRQKNNERLKQIVAEEIGEIDKSEAKIEDYFKKAKNYNINMTNVYREKLSYQQLIMKNEEIIKKLEAGEKVAGYTKDSIEYLKGSNAELEKEIGFMDQYIDLNKKEDSLNRKVTDAENKAYNTRAQNAKKAVEDKKKLVEEYKKFNNQIVLDTMSNQAKEIEAIRQAEEAKKAELKKFKDKGVITEAEYNNQLLKITEIYNKQRNEVEYKYAEQASKKREDILKKQFDLEKAEAQRRATNQEMMLEQEHQNNLNALNRREISVVEYYEREKELIAKNYDQQRVLLEEDFKKQSDLISAQINERSELLAQNGISDEQKANLTAEIAQLSDQLLTLQTEHNAALQDLAIETTNAIAETTRNIIDSEIENLHSMVDNVVGSMDAIAACGDGISTAWAGAFETLGNGLIDLTEKIKAGGAQWQDYGQLAVAGLQAASQVMNGLASQQDAQTKEGFEKQKKYQIAAATMSMLAGVTAALSGLFTTKSGPWDIALAAIQAGIITATGIAQIVKIKQQTFDGGGASTSAPSSSAAGALVAPVQYTQDVQGAEIEGAIKDTKVYVTETDISNTQNKVDVAESEARF